MRTRIVKGLLLAPIVGIVIVIVASGLLLYYLRALSDGAFSVPYRVGRNVPVPNGGHIAVRLVLEPLPVCGDPWAHGEATYVPETGRRERIGRWRGRPWPNSAFVVGQSLVFVADQKHMFVRTASGPWKRFALDDLDEWDDGSIDRVDRDRIARDTREGRPDGGWHYIVRSVLPEERLIVVDVTVFTNPTPARLFLRLSDDGERFTLHHLQRSTAAPYAAKAATTIDDGRSSASMTSASPLTRPAATGSSSR